MIPEGFGMNRRALPVLVGLLVLSLGCGGGPSSSPSLPGPNGDDVPAGPNERLVLQPTELCSDHPDYAIATFADATLEGRVRTTLLIGGQDDLTCGLVSGLARLEARGGVGSLAGIQNLTGLTELDLRSNSITDVSALSGLTNLTWLVLFNNSITDISPLSGLTSLTTLVLQGNSITDISAVSGLTEVWQLILSENSITDISPLSGLTSLTALYLDGNSITDIRVLSRMTGLRDLALENNPDLTDIQPLLYNTGLGSGDRVFLKNTNVSCPDVAALAARGVTGTSDCG